MADTTEVQPSRRLFGKRLMLWFAAIGAIMAVVMGLIFVSISSLISSGGWVEHSNRILNTLDVVAAQFNAAESAERGYVATCNTALIAPFRADIPQIYADLATLRVLTADNPRQLERVERLRSTLSAELSRMSVEMNTTTHGNQKAALTMLDQPQELRAIDDIINTISMMKTDEQKLLDTRLANVQRFGRLTLAACGLGAAATIAILVLVLWLAGRENRRREHSETLLQRTNARLGRSLTELGHYNELANAIARMGELLQTCRDTQEAFSITSTHLTRLLPGASGTLALFNSAHHCVEPVLTFGEAPPFEGEFGSDDCWALRRGRAHISVAGGVEPFCAHLAETVKTAECLPLIAQGETLGLMCVSCPKEEGFNEIERQTMQTISEQMSLALANLQLQETLRRQSLRDALTGVFNRRYLDEALPREIARAQRRGQSLSVAMLDIDHFKRFNDTYGHEGGDVLLARFGELLQQHCRAEDLVCRYGGEEFAVVMPGVSLATARERMEALSTTMKRMKVHLHGQPLPTPSFSAGVAAFPAHATNGPDLLNAADAALYLAKDAGRDRIAVAESLSGSGQLPLAG